MAIDRDIMQHGFVQRAIVLAVICAALVLIHVANVMSGGALMAFGVHPRELSSIYTIFTAPLLHADIGHLGNNLASLIVLGSLILIGGVRYFLSASAVIITLSGLLLWLLARDSVHLGASGWIFGLWSLAIVRAWYDRRWHMIAISIGVILIYGGMAYGMLPTDAGVSFEGHIFGALAGIVAARLLPAPVGVRRSVSAPVRDNELKFWS